MSNNWRCRSVASTNCPVPPCRCSSLAAQLSVPPVRCRLKRKSDEKQKKSILYSRRIFFVRRSRQSHTYRINSIAVNDWRLMHDMKEWRTFWFQMRECNQWIKLQIMSRMSRECIQLGAVAIAFDNNHDIQTIFMAVWHVSFPTTFTCSMQCIPVDFVH